MNLLSIFKPQDNRKPSLYPEAGLYHYHRQNDQEKARIHLRVDPDGNGILLINASRILHLNSTAATMAYLALNKKSEKEAVAVLKRYYRVSSAQAKSDYVQFIGQLDELIRPDGACPIHDLELETTLPFSARPTAPYRMDLALTYRCNNDCAHCYNPRPQKTAGEPDRYQNAELATADWKAIIDRLWELSIPHIVFTGGEPTLRPDLAELIHYAEAKGQITGLNTNGRRLSDPTYLDELVKAGLDHVQITLESHDPDIHDAIVCARGAWRQTTEGLKNVLSTRLFVMTNTTLLQQNSKVMDKTLQYLSDLQVPTIGLNALIYSGRGKTVESGLRENELSPLLDMARQHTEAYQQRLIWYTPTEYCHFDPVQMNLGVKGCTAALYNMCIEPNGDVLPCQSYYQALGNLLHDCWDSIWNHDLSVRLRERKDIDKKCIDCALLAECGGGCPLAREKYSEMIKPEVSYDQHPATNS
jgi:radical SAM protein with 4Fe4S-binding SPASM domain